MGVYELAFYLNQYQFPLLPSDSMSALILYIGPETLMPLVSVLTAIIGLLLLVWQHVVALVRRGFQFCKKQASRIFMRNKVPADVRSEARADADGGLGKGGAESGG
ncbi:MAG: hypothetical protein L0Y67_06400 [Gammaproteobacteria bacterium]|nr:hypothetical protein [Gammaproteobacteria bacterium]